MDMNQDKRLKLHDDENPNVTYASKDNLEKTADEELDRRMAAHKKLSK